MNPYLFFLLSDKIIQRLGGITEPIVGIIVDTIVANLEFVNLLFQWFLLVVGEFVTELSLEMLCRADSVTDLGLFGLYLSLKSLNEWNEQMQIINLNTSYTNELCVTSIFLIYTTAIIILGCSVVNIQCID